MVCTGSGRTTTLQSLGGVPTSRTVNGKPLSSDITLSADDVGASKSNHTHTMSDISGTLPVSKGGTGASTLTNGAALIGGGTSPVSTRNITHNTAVTATIPSNSNLITANTLLVALNRNTSVGNADTAYAAYMARGIALLTSAPVSLENGCCAFIYQ